MNSEDYIQDNHNVNDDVNVTGDDYDGEADGPSSTSGSVKNSFEPVKAFVIVLVSVVVAFSVMKAVDSKASDNQFISQKSESIVVTTTSTTSVSGTTADTQSSNTASSDSAVVAVLNSTTTAGAASKVATAVESDSFSISGTGNDSSENIGTTIYFAKGYEEVAQQIAQDQNVLAAMKAAGVNATLVTEDIPSTLPSDWDSSGDAKLDTANIIIVLGKSL